MPWLAVPASELDLKCQRLGTPINGAGSQHVPDVPGKLEARGSKRKRPRKEPAHQGLTERRVAEERREGEELAGSKGQSGVNKVGRSRGTLSAVQGGVKLALAGGGLVPCRAARKLAQSLLKQPKTTGTNAPIEAKAGATNLNRSSTSSEGITPSSTKRAQRLALLTRVGNML